MTTLIKFDNVLAVDSLTNCHGTKRTSNANKLIRLPTGAYAFAGSMGNLVAKAKQAEHAIELYHKGEVVNNRTYEKYDCCLAKVNDKFYTVEEDNDRLIVGTVTETYAAFGHGGDVALGAMYASHNLQVSIKVVSDLDLYTGGEWQFEGEL